jgi:hypothetical protein
VSQFPSPSLAREAVTSRRYTLVVIAWNAGFFSHVNRVVNHLHHTLGHDGCAAIRVDWRVNENTPLFVYGTEQDGELWQRFFEPLDFPDAPAEERASYEYADLAMTGLHAYRMYKRGSHWRAEYGRAFAGRVHVREELRRRAAELWRDGAGGPRNVGVHYRHPEHSHECPRDMPAMDAFIARTRAIIEHEPSASVVLATDVREAVDGFRDAFGERLLVQPDVARSPANAMQYAWDAPRGVRMGQQALIDALLLARCDVLVHTTSNLATAVGYMNPRLRMVYCESPLRGITETVRARLGRRGAATLAGVSRRTPEEAARAPLPGR